MRDVVLQAEKGSVRAPLPATEPERLAALQRLEILDTPPEQAFDDLVALAARLCRTPISLISLIDANRQWFKAAVGLTARETPREFSFCAHAILQRDVFVLTDAAADDRFSANPLVTGDPGIRFYAGAPLITSEGDVLGTLCVMDRVPRELSDREAEVLRVLSRQVVAQLELRRANAEAARTVTQSRAITEELRNREQLASRMVEASGDCIKVLDLDGNLLSMNANGMAALEICELAPFLNSSWIDFWEGKDREAAQRAVDVARQGDTGRFLGFFATAQTRQPRWWDVVVSPILNQEGRLERLLAVSRDVTERKRAEDTLRILAQGTADVTGTDFFRSLVRHLAVALPSKCAFVAECTDARRTRVRTLAFWNGQDFADNIAFALAGTPCEHVIAGQVCHYPEQLQRLFPDDVGLVGLQAESYLGVPLRSASGEVLGHLAALDDRPMPSRPDDVRTLAIFAARAAAELERKRADEALRAVHRFNQEIISGAAEGIVVYDADLRYVVFNRFMEELTGRRAADVLGRYAPDCFPFLREQGIEAYLQRALQGEIVMAPDTLVRMPDGREVWESCRYGPHVDAEGQVIGVVALVSDVTQRKLAETALQQALTEVKQLKDKLQAENVYLQEEIKAQQGFEEVVGRSPALVRVLRQVEQVAPTDATVLICGETGTGKELVARGIHQLSRRRERPLINVNCGAISAGLIESELFGHEKGAFTGALARKIGRFELADGGTIFLDEIGDLALDLQVKLLRVLQEGEIERVGGSTPIKVDVRVIAATHHNLEQAVQAGRFRSDLYYRLNVFPIAMPSLRERKEDIVPLVSYFVALYGRKLGKRVESISKSTLEALTAYQWPGNVRELRNVIERSIITSPASTLELGDWIATRHNQPRQATPGTLEEVERRHIVEELERAGWKVSGREGAAQALGLKPTTLEARMKKLGIKRPH